MTLQNLWNASKRLDNQPNVLKLWMLWRIFKIKILNVKMSLTNEDIELSVSKLQNIIHVIHH